MFPPAPLSALHHSGLKPMLSAKAPPTLMTTEAMAKKWGYKSQDERQGLLSGGKIRTRVLAMSSHLKEKEITEQPQQGNEENGDKVGLWPCDK